MGNWIYTDITIGGTVSAATAKELRELLDAEMDGDGGPEIVGGHLFACGQRNYGNADEVEDFCQEHGLPYVFPWSTVARGGPGRQELEELEALFDHLMPPAVEPATAQIADAQEDTTDAAAVDPRADLHVDLETMGLAGAIVAQADSWVFHDDYAASLTAFPQVERYRLVEDALLAWPAMMEPCAFVDGEPVETEAGRPEDESAPPAAGCDTAGAMEPGASPAAPEAVAEPAPRVKPRYRVRADGSYELVTEG